MSNYQNTKHFQLRHTDFDFKDELKLSSVLSFFQDSAGASADELGFGDDRVKELGYGFLVVNTDCRILRPVHYREKELEVDTWPLPPRHVIFERAYRMRAGEETVAVAMSRWCLVDLNGFTLLTGDKLGRAHTDCPYRAERVIESPLWKIPKITEGKEMYRFVVGSSQCDRFYHANNTRYADFFVDCFSLEELSRPVQSFQISYSKQAKAGTELSLMRYDEEDCSLCEARADGNTLTQFRIRFGESPVLS